MYSGQAAGDHILLLRLASDVLDERALKTVHHRREGAAHREVHLDLAAIRLPTAEGLRAVIHLHKDLRDRGGRLVLVNVPDEVHEVFHVTGLVKVLDVRRAFSPSPGC